MRPKNFAEGAVGHGSKKQEKSTLEGESERGGEGHGVGQKGDIMDSNQQQFCLKWNSFGSNLATAFSNLFKSESLTDVTLFCQGVTFKAHRLILAACSKHFQELFEGMPATPAGLIVILDGMSAQNMASLLEFMYRGEVHVSQESLSSFLKAAECLQVKGLSIEHEKLAVAQRHAAETKSSDSGVAEPIVNNIAETAETPGTPELPQGNHIKRTPTPAPSPAPTYPLPSAYHTAQYYDNPQKKLLSRSPSDIDSLRRASVLRDGAAFRPASAPHPLLLENPYQPFVHHPDTPSHPHTAPHTPTDLKREFARDSSTERENGDLKENVAEDLRIKQEPFSISDRERAEKLAESLSREVYANNQSRYDSRNYGNNTDHAHHGAQLAQGMANLPPAHPTPEISPAMWNSKINKAGTVTTPDGKKLKCPFCDRLYGYETNLRAHIRQRHQGIRVPCPFCSRTFTRNNTVRRHIAREHKNELSLKTFHQQAGHAVSDAVPQ